MKRALPAVAGSIFLLQACAPIRPWPVLVPVPTETLLPPTKELVEYTSGQGLALQLGRATQHCGLVKQAIANELDQRERRLNSRRSGLLLVGSLAGLATTVYAGIATNPKKEVVIPLGAISGTSFASALPSLGKDERIETLRERIVSIRNKETSAIDAWNALERGILGIGLLKQQIDRQPEGSTARADLQTQLDGKYNEIAPVEERMRTSLALLANECS